jgi:phospholipid transport system transporter-binding protein
VSETRLEQQEAGHGHLTGALTFDTVPQLFQQGRQLFADSNNLQLDLAGVERSDSAGLALLVGWVRLARQCGGTITFLNVPQQLLGLARVGGVDQVLIFT